MRKVLYLAIYLTENDLNWIMDTGEKRNVSGGTVLIEKGQPINTLYIVLDGFVKLSGVDIGDKPIRLGCGEVLGEISLLDSRPPTATVTADNDAIILAITHSDLSAKLQEDIGFASRFYHSLATMLAHRLRNTYSQLGYGLDQRLDEDADYEDELSPELLDTVHLTGSRFTRALQRKLAE